jgi:hypothetical protein
LDFYVVSVFAKRFSEVGSEIRCNNVILKYDILDQLNCINFPGLEGPFFPSHFQTKTNEFLIIPVLASYPALLNLLAPELFFFILAHSVYKMLIIQETNKIAL